VGTASGVNQGRVSDPSVSTECRCRTVRAALAITQLFINRMSRSHSYLNATNGLTLVACRAGI
jgi:hypothetical protein